MAAEGVLVRRVSDEVLRRWAEVAPDGSGGPCAATEPQALLLCTRDHEHPLPHAAYGRRVPFPYAVWPMDDGSLLVFDEVWLPRDEP